MRHLLAAALICTATPAIAADPPPACATPAFRALDFWLGDWEAHWAPSEGDSGVGSNHISQSYDGCVIEEHFDGHPGQHLMGHSVSMYVAPEKIWRQTWVDNEGGYIELSGGPQPDGDFVLTTGRRPSGRIARMVFSDITPDSFTWRWQSSTDGAAWNDAWVIHYTRKK
ncbi:MAG: hypothetical protein JSR60_12210 [Proteobacteria bacterium]|nr:hypothetical protein [Pseudomonadota bacterium]